MNFATIKRASLPLIATLPLMAVQDEGRLYEDEVKPLLKDECFKCHSHESGKSKGGLKLDSINAILSGGTSGPAVVPGSPEKSPLIKAVRRHDEDTAMPPKKALTERQITLLSRWVANGAPAPQSDVRPDTTLTERAQQLWSLRPLKRFDRIDRSLDHFVDKRLDAEGLTPVHRAAPTQLIRRLYLDLIGLPPTPVEIRKFLESPTEQAYATMVDELLARPQFGERWARHWLDTARYADSNGTDQPHIFKQSWRYRDWVIDACNDDLPYHQFLAQQIAGDLLPATDESTRQRQIIATGFLSLGSKNLPNREEEVGPYRYDNLNDPVDAVMTGMMGMTFGCAKCHDHKFDPISAADYHALAGIFQSTRLWHGPDYGQLGPRQHLSDHLYDPNLFVLDNERRQRFAPIQERYFKVKEGKRKLDQRRKSKAVANLREKIAQENDPARQAKLSAELTKLENDLQQWEDDYELFLCEHQDDLDEIERNRLTQVMAATEGKPQDLHLRYGGVFNRKGPLIPRGLPSLIQVPGVDVRIGESESGRRQLAEFITSERNPLTPRVAVNRIWQRLFGRGLVETVDNFGLMGSLPSHPDLLDYLADGFVRHHHWSRKKLIRQIVLSRAYQRSAVVTEERLANTRIDPENIFVWRMVPRRLESETIRDSMLAIAGNLDPTRPQGSVLENFDYSLGGPLKGEVINAVMERMKNRARTIYIPTLRPKHHALQELFDYPNDEVVRSARLSSTFASQGLFLLNNPLVVDSARAFAKRIRQDPGRHTIRDNIETAYLLAVGRSPESEELTQAIAFLNDSRHEGDENWVGLCQSLLASGEFLYRY